ncbi:NUDIX domain-containing protein [Prauserella oleivorans]|uniref:NUDIX domain-containing protein n=1 Tax=Prauserella oleivorans TaxID=1478153 RepID=A0ABW5W6H6_9PSEU
MSTLVAVLALLALLVVACGLYLVATANRLDRLHVRMDAGWAALDAALARRAVVARTVAASALTGAEAERLREAAQDAEAVPRPERELAENELTRLLGAIDRTRLPRPLADELADAEHRVVIARRVYNDAVRDTLALRRRRDVRYFKLAGTARLPEYFEIAEPELDPASALPRPRTAARVVLVDDQGRVLLCRGHDPDPDGAPSWGTVGGTVEDGEDLRAAAVRELKEATGLDTPGDRLVGPVWRRRVETTVGGRPVSGTEWYFLAETTATAARTSGTTELRWWRPDELARCGEPVHPAQLPQLLPEVLDGGWDGRLRSIR